MGQRAVSRCMTFKKLRVSFVSEKHIKECVWKRLLSGALRFKNYKICNEIVIQIMLKYLDVLINLWMLNVRVPPHPGIQRLIDFTILHPNKPTHRSCQSQHGRRSLD